MAAFPRPEISACSSFHPPVPGDSMSRAGRSPPPRIGFETPPGPAPDRAAEPAAGLIGVMMEPVGIEPTTSCLQDRRSPG